MAPLPDPPVPERPLNAAERRRIAAWCLYDFANSSYSAIVPVTLFSTWFTGVICAGRKDGEQLWGLVMSGSMLFVALTSPFLGGIADRAGLRKRLLFAYTLLCAGAVAAFPALGPGTVLPAVLLALLANIGLEGALVFYNSYLPSLAPPSHQGRVSSWGFATGYVGSLAALGIAFAWLSAHPGRFGPVWLMVAGFLLLFSLPAFLVLPADPRPGAGIARAAREGFQESLRILGELFRVRDARLFLAAYLLYEDGVATAIAFSGIFAEKVHGFEKTELLLLFSVVQISALAGAAALAKAVDRRGPRAVVMGSLLWWCAVVTAAFTLRTKDGFWGVAVAAGLGLGTVQAASRAFFSRFVPKGREAEYFGVYSLVGKSSAILGPLLYGLVVSRLGDYPAILSVAVFYAAGLAILWKVKEGGPARPG